jgi:hypothetical protein
VFSPTVHLRPVGVDASSASGDPADVGIQQFALTGVDGSTNLDA